MLNGETYPGVVGVPLSEIWAGGVGVERDILDGRKRGPEEMQGRRWEGRDVPSGALMKVGVMSGTGDDREGARTESLASADEERVSVWEWRGCTDHDWTTTMLALKERAGPAEFADHFDRITVVIIHVIYSVICTSKVP